MLKECALGFSLLAAAPASAYLTGANGFDNWVDRGVQDDFLGQFSRKIVAKKLSQEGRCEFEFTMDRTAYRMEGVLVEQQPLIKLEEAEGGRVFVMSLGNRSIVMESDGQINHISDLGYDHSTDPDQERDKAKIDKALRTGMWGFNKCKAIPEPGKPDPALVVERLKNVVLVEASFQK